MRKFWQRDVAPVADVETTDRVPSRATWTAVPRWRLAATLVLALVNAALSAALLMQHHGHPRASAAVGQVCGTGAESGCETVARSPYSEVRGVPVAAIGLAFALSLSLLAALGLLGGPETRATAAGMALVTLFLALAAAVVLLGVQIFLIKAFCKLCVLTYAVNALALMLLLPARRRGATLGTGMRYPEGRVAMAGWGLGSLAAVAAVLAFDMALAARAGAHGPASPLGRSAASYASPAPAGSEAQRYQEEARVAQEQTRRLQEILDDPKKLEEYFAEKASREYEQGPVQNFNLKGAPFKGPGSAPIRVVEFSDFLCPYCRSIAGAFSSYLPQSANRVVLYFKNYPLEQSCNPNVTRTVHPGACNLALGAVCAQDQGKFWAYHDRVFEAPPSNPGISDVVALATTAGLDGGALAGCMNGSSARDRLAAEIQEAKQARVDATPTVFINGRRLPRINDFVQTVDREAVKIGLPPLAPQAAAGHPPAAPR